MNFKNIVFRGVVGVGVFFLSACSDNNFESADKLSKPRILAIVADKPEVNEGTVVSFSSVLSFPAYAGELLEHEALGCPDPGVSIGVNPTCDGVVSAVTLLSKSAVTLSGPTYTQLKSNIFSTSAPTGFLSLLSSVDSYNGAAYLVDYRFYVGGQIKARAFKRIVVSTRGVSDLNANPTLSDLLVNAGSWSTKPNSSVSVSPSIAGGSAQSYPIKNVNGSLGTLTENVEISWFSSSGRFLLTDTKSSAANTFYGAEATATTYTVVAVLRDNRGGLSVVIKTF